MRKKSQKPTHWTIPSTRCQGHVCSLHPHKNSRLGVAGVRGHQPEGPRFLCDKAVLQRTAAEVGVTTATPLGPALGTCELAGRGIPSQQSRFLHEGREGGENSTFLLGHTGNGGTGAYTVSG